MIQGLKLGIGRGAVAVGREAAAMARQATLLHRDLRLTVSGRATAREDVVVLLHGLFATAGVLRPMRDTIERRCRAATASFSYFPALGAVALAERVRELVATLPEFSRVHLVGHSLGGIAMRWYVQELGVDARVVQTISIASPFCGSQLAEYLPGPAGRDIRPTSELLARLRRSAQRVTLPHLSIYSSADALVPRGASLDHGEVLCVSGCGHNALLYDARVIEAVAARVRSGSDLAHRGAKAW